MNLALDVGNTYTKLAIFDGDELVYSEAHELMSIERLREIISEYPIKRAIFSSVSKSYYNFERLLDESYYFLKLSHNTPTPVVNKYATPKTLGKDRIAGAVGAHALYPNDNVLVIDAGTCVTYDLTTKNGEYLGGNISPGLTIRLKALNNYTERLPLLEKQKIDYLIGNSTNTSILSGVIMGLAAELDGMINAYAEKYPELKVVITGGDAKFFESYMKNSIFAVPNLVLVGLNKIIEYNAQPNA